MLDGSVRPGGRMNEITENFSNFSFADVSPIAPFHWTENGKMKFYTYTFKMRVEKALWNHNFHLKKFILLFFSVFFIFSTRSLTLIRHVQRFCFMNYLYVIFITFTSTHPHRRHHHQHIVITSRRTAITAIPHRYNLVEEMRYGVTDIHTYT